MAFETISLGTQPAGTGGDTARTAFEKVNRNFIAADVLAAAMSQAQFDTTREQNKEDFAASGSVHFGKHYAAVGTGNIKDGLWSYPAVGAENALFLGHELGYDGRSKSNRPILNMAGIIYDVFDGSSPQFSESFKVKFAQAPEGKTVYNKATGAITTYSTALDAFNAAATDTINLEVVTDRVDIWGFESFLEEVTTSNPYVYHNGLIQCKSTTMDDIATSASNRPITYYAMFEGDTTSKGSGLNFFALNDAQKKKVLSNHKNKIYYLDDGRLVQWRLRARTFAGAGNGDWNLIDCIIGDSLKVTNKLNITAQGSKDYRSPYISYDIGSNSYRSAIDPLNYKKNIGLYTVLFTSTDTAVNEECYFLVCGTVNRLNQGSYHLSFNPSGAAKFVGDTLWSSTAASITSKADCFDSAKLLAGSGSIASGKSGRPDGRYYDGIYSNGQGGVCRDTRYSAHGVDLIDFAEADQKVKNGTYRGFEKAKLTTALSSVDSKISVGGNFLVTEVIATSAVINATAVLSGGWSGFKNAQSPTGSISTFELSRDAVSTPTALRSTNNGASWSVFTPAFNAVNNSVTLTNEPAANIVILQYQAFAKQTESAPNAAIYGLVPYNVFASSDYRPENGALLGESLIGKVLKNNSGVSVNNKSLLSCAIDSTGKLTSAANFDGITHQALTLGSPANNSPAFKVVSYLANISQQAIPHFAYTELRHNGTSFGDDGKQTIVDNQSTKPNDHGVTVSVGTARLREPIGWFKNKV